MAFAKAKTSNPEQNRQQAQQLDLTKANPVYGSRIHWSHIYTHISKLLPKYTDTYIHVIYYML